MTSALPSTEQNVHRRGEEVRRVLVIVLVLNIAVAVAKAGYGILSGSLAIATDAVHSTVDASSNIIGLIVIYFASAPPDKAHPYGHHKLEIVAAAGIGIAIAYAAVRFTVSAIDALLYGAEPPETSAAGFALLVATLVVNIAVARYEARRAAELDSAYLAADASHTASDILVTCGVLASFAATHLGWQWADPAGALVVIAVVAHVAWTILRSNVSILIDRAAVDTAVITAAAMSVPGVLGCHRVRSRGTAGIVHLDMHVLVAGDLPLRDAHTIAHTVEDTLRRTIPGVIDVTIHVEPDDDEVEHL